MLTLVPNPYYYGRKPHIMIQLPLVATPLDSYRQYLAGALDSTLLPAEYASTWKRQHAQYYEFPTSEVDFLVPNVRLAPYSNVHCRLALAYAIDRNALASQVQGGSTRAAYAILPEGMLGSYDGHDNPHYNLSRARAELAQCPARAMLIRLVYPKDLPLSSHAAVTVGGMMAAAGMNVKLQALGLGVWVGIVDQSLDTSKTQLAFSGWIEDYPDPHDYCTVLLRSGEQFNVGSWHDTSYDRLVDIADVTLDQTKRAQLYIEAQHIALSQGALISLDNQLQTYLIKPWVHGLVGMEAYQVLVPKDLDWANVSVSPH
jgi:ABC-type oligopeptide transport system substrate-binding subunit